MKIKENEKKPEKTFWNDFKDGYKYIFSTPKIFYLQLFLAVFCFLIMIYPMLMPIYVKDIYSANADTLGFLMAMIGFGALASSLLIASKKDNKNLKTILTVSAVLLGCCFIVLSFVKNIYLSAVVAIFMGLSVTGFITPQISILQSFIEDKFRGRVMSNNSFCILGIPAVSTIISGLIIEKIGILHTFILYGLILIFTAIFFADKIREN